MSAENSIIIAAIGFAVALVLLTAFYAGNSMVNAMVQNSQVNSSESTRTSLLAGQTQFNKFDYIYFAFFIGVVLSTIIAGFLVGGHPIFMGIYFIVVIISSIVAAIISNVWETFTGTSQFIASAASFPITNHIMGLLPMYAVITGILGMIAMFAKPYLFGRE